MPLVDSTRTNRAELLNFGIYGLPPFMVSLFFYLLSPNDILWIQFTLAVLLLQIPWTTYLKWKKRADEKLPVFALISLMYWVYYAVALFWGARTPSGVDTPFEQILPQESITWSLALAVIGVSAIWLGMKIGVAKNLVPNKLPELKPGLGSTHFLRLLLLVGTLLSSSESFPYVAGEGGRQVLTIIISTVPILAFAILFRNVVVGKAEPIDKIFVLGFLALRLVIGLSSGWLGSFASIIVICAAIYLSERKKVPRLVLLLVVIFTLFFQVSKQEFRRAYWTNETQTSKVDRVRFWTETSLGMWQEALSDPSGEALAKAINSSLSRVSLLTQTANVVDLTPSIVPYQGTHLYSYLVVTWVPRALWSDKPSMNESNQFYQLAYGLNTEEGLESVSIGVGVMTESYISFGLYGVVGVMFLMGVFYDVYGRMFFSNTSGLLMTSIGIALLPQMMSIESQMAAYLGGVVQQVVFTILLFIPMIRWKQRRSPIAFSFLPASSQPEVPSLNT